MEIERKWLIKGFPNKSFVIDYSATIDQAYLSIDPEVRIRRSTIGEGSNITSSCFLAIKSNGTLSRSEVEIEISEDQYEELRRFMLFEPIIKKYRVYNFAGYKIEMSIVDNTWYYAEVEFETEKDAEEFEFPFPNLVVKEVTDDLNFKMKNYWKYSRIDGKKADKFISSIYPDYLQNVINDTPDFVEVDLFNDDNLGKSNGILFNGIQGHDSVNSDINSMKYPYLV